MSRTARCLPARRDPRTNPPVGNGQAGVGKRHPRHIGGRLGYAKGPFNGAVAYGQTQVTSDLEGDQFNLGASWNFCVVMVSGYYGNISVGNLSQDNWYIGATTPVGVWTFKASYGQASRSGTEGTLSIEGQKASQFALGATYDLSRRTALYSTYSTLSNKDGARFIVAPLQNTALGGSVASANSQGFEMGIKHSF